MMRERHGEGIRDEEGRRPKKLSSSMKFPPKNVLGAFFPNNNTVSSFFLLSLSSSSSSRLSKNLRFETEKKKLKKKKKKNKVVVVVVVFSNVGVFDGWATSSSSSSSKSNQRAWRQKTTFKINAGLSSFTFPKFQGKNRSAAER